MRPLNKIHFAIAGVAASSFFLAAPAFAGPGPGGNGPGGDRPAAQASGACSANATWKLKAKGDDGRIETELEVDGIAPNRTWHVMLMDNGATFFTGNRRATNGDDSFKVETRSANRPGTDHIVAQATNTVNGQVCEGSVRL
jgi:hypothetical protein